VFVPVFIRADLAENGPEIAKIKKQLGALLQNEQFDLDSVVVSANSSPEGLLRSNARLSESRSKSVTRYFDSFMNRYRDSLQAEKGFSVDLDGKIHREKIARIPIRSRSTPENWKRLDQIVETDESIPEAFRERYRKYSETADLDAREALMRKDPFYAQLKEQYYPKLRTVEFDFHLHRKGMVKDTVETTVVDEVYAEGLQALKDRDYEKAIELLGPYNDYNAAVAYLAMDRNHSALEILKKEKVTPEVNYMMAIIKSRMGDVQGAVESYLAACRADNQYVYRGNLDPEISALIKKYDLNKQDDDEYELYL